MENIFPLDLHPHVRFPSVTIHSAGRIAALLLLFGLSFSSLLDSFFNIQWFPADWAAID